MAIDLRVGLIAEDKKSNDLSNSPDPQLFQACQLCEKRNEKNRRGGGGTEGFFKTKNKCQRPLEIAMFFGGNPFLFFFFLPPISV